MSIDQNTFIKIVNLLTSDKELDYKAIALRILVSDPNAFLKAVEAIEAVKAVEAIEAIEAIEAVKALHQKDQPPPGEESLGALMQQLHGDQPVLAVDRDSTAADIIQPLVVSRDKIATIKRLREATGWGLKESKAVIDAVLGGEMSALRSALHGDQYSMYMLLRQEYLNC